MLSAKDRELAAMAELRSRLETALAEEHAKLTALTTRRIPIARPKSPFETPYSDPRLIAELLRGALRYAKEMIPYRLAGNIPEDAAVHASYTIEDKQEVLTCAVVRHDTSLSHDAMRWMVAIGNEHQHIVDLQATATLIATKLNLVTGHLEHVKIADRVELARDFSHLLATGGLAILRVLTNMNAALKSDKLDRKLDHVILLLDSEQVGRFNGIFLAAARNTAET